MKRAPLVPLALVAGLLLAACGGSKDSTSGGSHNAADVSFAQDMIPHHQQAIEMTKMVTGRSSTPEVEALARRIQAAQDPEIETMSGWLRSWGEDVPSSTGMGGHGDHGSMSMPGMMSSEDMNALMAKRGTDFDRTFLEMMTMHHQGAIEMARTEQAEGSHGPAKDLAGRIATDQQAEIDQMAALLTKL